MKIIITGAGGQLGKELVKILSNEHNEVFHFTRSELDITDPKKVEKVCSHIKPEIIINCAAFTNVDLCEMEVERAFLVNGLGPIYLGIAANKINAKLVHISTDYVFSGETTQPYKEKDPTNPQTTYGKSKLLGEEILQKNCNNLLIVRTSWLFGHDSDNFVRKMISLSEKGKPICVVNDQVGSPSYTSDVAKVIQSLMKNKTGIYHVTNSGICSWYEFSKEIMRQTNTPIEIIPISSEEYQFKTPRPSYSVLDNDKVKKEGLGLRDWQAALSNYISKEGFYNEH